jgi:hypothetical protein
MDLAKLFEKYESGLQTFVVIVILGYVLLFGSVFEATYPTRLVELYAYPWWRLLIVMMVVIGSWWSPKVGLTLAIAIFFYLNDMQLLTNPFLSSMSK